MNPRVQAAIELEDAVAQAIHEFERKVPSRLCVGLSVTRLNQVTLQVEALLIPKNPKRPANESMKA